MPDSDRESSPSRRAAPRPPRDDIRETAPEPPPAEERERAVKGLRGVADAKT